jgi:exopolysaccharide biosynthesis polyprenyl glycosylphosphotransferase
MHDDVDFRGRVSLQTATLAVHAVACAAAWLVVIRLSDPTARAWADAAAIASASLLCVFVAGFESASAARGPLRILHHRRTLRACLASGLAVLATDFAFAAEIGPVAIVVGTVAATGTVVVCHGALDALIGHLRRRGHLVERVLVVAENHEAARLFALVDAEAASGWRLCGAAGACRATALSEAVPYLGACADIAGAAARSGATIVLASASALHDERCRQHIHDLRDRGLDVHIDPNLVGFDMRHVRMATLGHDPLLVLDQPRLRGTQRVLKRALDIAVAGLVLVFAAPVLAFAVIAIKLDDRGPILFRQRRVGRDGNTFVMPKLRTMSVDAEKRLDDLRHLNEREGGPLFKLADDPRVTRVGKLLRATSIDELPQLVSVLRGDMSLIGPRPALPAEVETFDDRLARRHRVRPGVTGLWQVEERDSSSFEAYRRLDLFYVENWSLLLDLTILLQTVPAVIARAWSSVRTTRGTDVAGDVAASTVCDVAIGHDLVPELEPTPAELVAS